MKYKIGDPVYYDDGKVKSVGIIVDIRKYKKGSFYTINWNPPIPYYLHNGIIKDETHIGSNDIRKFKKNYDKRFS